LVKKQQRAGFVLKFLKRTVFYKWPDKLLLSFRVTNPDFYTNYLNARIIVDLGAGKGPEVVPGAPVG